MSTWHDVVLLFVIRCLNWGVHLSKASLTVVCLLNCALENLTGNLSRMIVLFSVFLLLQYNCVVVVHMSLCIHNYRWTTMKLHSNNNKHNNNNEMINLHKFFNVFVLIIVVLTVSFCFCCSSVIVHPQLQLNNKTTLHNNKNNNK